MGVVIDDQLTFKSHVCNMLKRVSQKLNALTRIKNRRIIMNAYINLQFDYYPMVLMIQNRTMN